MRISDWSSDVCSSDLAQRWSRHGAGGVVLCGPRPLSDPRRWRLIRPRFDARLQAGSGRAAVEPTWRWRGGVVRTQALVGSAPLALDPTYVQRAVAGRLKPREIGRAHV